MSSNLAKFRKHFFLEAREKLTAIQAEMVELEQDSEQPETLLALRRHVHTVKGSARMVGLDRISTLAHQLEDILDFLQQQGAGLEQETINSLYHGIDALNALLEEAESGKEMDSETPLPPLNEKLLQLVETSRKQNFAASKKHGHQEKDAGKSQPRRIQLDFESMRRHLATAMEEKKANSKDKESGPAERPPAAATTFPASPPRFAQLPSPLRASEKKYIKVENERIEDIVNQATDLLTKSFSFRGIAQKLLEGNRLALALKESFRQVEKSSPATEQMLQAGLMLDLLERNLSSLEKNFELNSLSFFNLLNDLCAKLLDLKLTPLSSITGIYPRFARDLAFRSGKKVRLFMRGCDLELDQAIIDKIGEPLVHLLRNALDHGIESPQTRKERGKDATATVVIEAGKTATHAYITVSDDGAGLNREEILKKAREKKIITKHELDKLSDQEVYNLVFTPGLSTSSEISEISGRGLGMEIVRKTIQQINGRVAVSSAPGIGTTVKLEFPVSIFTTSILILADEDRLFAIPSSLVGSLRKIGRESLKKSGHETMVTANGKMINVRKLSRILGFNEKTDNDRREWYLLTPRVSDRPVGLLLDEVIQETEAIVKETGPFLGKQLFVHGLTLNEKGEVVVVLDLYDLIAAENFDRPEIQNPDEQKNEQTKKEKKKSVLLIDDSLPVREILRSTLEHAGFLVDTARNGLDGFQKALSGFYDLIVTDIEMPEMDGFEMIDKLKKSEQYQKTPFIILSTRENDNDKARGLRAGASAWISKQTFVEKEFTGLVRSLIE